MSRRLPAAGPWGSVSCSTTELCQEVNQTTPDTRSVLGSVYPGCYCVYVLEGCTGGVLLGGVLWVCTGAWGYVLGGRVLSLSITPYKPPSRPFTYFYNYKKIIYMK